MIEKMREFENSKKKIRNLEKIRSENREQCLGLITKASKHELARIYERLRKMRKMLPKKV